MSVDLETVRDARLCDRAPDTQIRLPLCMHKIRAYAGVFRGIRAVVNRRDTIGARGFRFFLRVSIYVSQSEVVMAGRIFFASRMPAYPGRIEIERLEIREVGRIIFNSDVYFRADGDEDVAVETEAAFTEIHHVSSCGVFQRVRFETYWNDTRIALGCTLVACVHKMLLAAVFACLCPCVPGMARFRLQVKMYISPTIKRQKIKSDISKGYLWKMERSHRLFREPVPTCSSGTSCYPE